MTNRLQVRNLNRSIKVENPAQVRGKRDEVCRDPVKKRGFVGTLGRKKRWRNGERRVVGDLTGDDLRERTIGGY